MPVSNALLVIDVQNFYAGSMPDDLPARIAAHFKAVSYDTIALAVFKNQSSSNFVHSLKWNKCSEDADAELPEELQQFVTTDNVFTRAAYSAFHGTKLHEYLQEKKVERLILCGIDVDACVLATAFTAFDLGYHVKVDYDLSYSTVDLADTARKIIDKSINSRD